MKMFKRFAAALLAGVMVLAMLTACGGGAGGPGESEFEKKVQDVYMAALNKEYGTEWSNNSEVKAVYYEETTAGTITVNSDMVELMKTATDLVINLGKQNNTKIEVTGLGVGTKTVGGKTYVAIGYKLSK